MVVGDNDVRDANRGEPIQDNKVRVVGKNRKGQDSLSELCSFIGRGKRFLGLLFAEESIGSFMH